MQFFYPYGALAADGWEVVATMAHTGLRVGRPGTGGLDLPAGEVERIVVPLSSGCEVLVEGVSHALDGRISPFDSTDVLYLGPGTAARITAPGRVAVCEARASEPRAARRYPAETDGELRGGGPASRLVRNFGTPENLDAERIIACEVVTPSGNWSSYPPHKHDHEVPGIESELEEIYYFASRAQTGAPAAAEPHGYLAVDASDDREIEVRAHVRDGDTVLIPYGWHGPAMAPPGYDLYYLNVMAGPRERAWRISDHPAHGWVRETWAAAGIDPRLKEALS